MKNNNLYNLMTQLTQEARSLWRIEDDYIKDAKKSPASKKFWTMLIKEKQKHIEDLKQLIKAEMK